MTQQLTAEDLKGMTAEQIDAAREAGQLDTLLGRSVRSRVEGQLTSEHLGAMTPEEVAAAHAGGQLDDLLSRPATAPPAS